MKQKKAYTIGKTADLPIGAHKVVDCGGKSVGVFNVNGSYYALLNYCPHAGGALCRGPVTGTTLTTERIEYIYGRAGEIIRCAWHGWEFEIATGQALVDDKVRAKKYAVTVENGDDVVVYI